MAGFLRGMAIALSIGIWVAPSEAGEIAAKEIAKKQIRELNQQTQDIKQDVLDISTELVRLEENLIYPPATRISIFLSESRGDEFRPDAIKIRIDGKDAAHHGYTGKEWDALQRGGVQRIYTGNIRDGEHTLEIALTGKAAGKSDYQLKADYKFIKSVGAKIIEINLAGSDPGLQSVNFRD